MAERLAPGPHGERILELMILQLPFFLLVNFSQGILKWTFRRWHFLCISVGSTLGTLVGLLVALALTDLNVLELFGVYLGVRAVFGLLGLWFVREWLAWPSGFVHLRELVPFAVPFGIICVALSLLPFLERGIVASVVGSEGLGLYAAGAKVAMLIGLVINAFETSWGPFSLALHREPDAARTFRAVLRLAATGLCATTLLLTGFGDAVVVLLGSAKYEGAGLVVFALAMGMAVQSIGAVTEVGIVFSKRSHLKLYAYGLGLVVAAVAMPALGSRFGIVGVAWGSLAGYASKAVFEAWLAQKVHPIDWRYAGPVGLCVLTLAIGLAHQIWFDQAAVRGVRWLPMLGLPVLLGVGWYGLLDPDDRRRALARWRVR